MEISCCFMPCLLLQEIRKELMFSSVLSYLKLILEFVACSLGDFMHIS